MFDNLTAEERERLAATVERLASFESVDGFQFGETVLDFGVPTGWNMNAWGRVVRDAAKLPFKDGSVSSYLNPNRRSITERVNPNRYTTDAGREAARQASRRVKVRRIASGEVAEYERKRYASDPQHQLAHKVRSRFAHALRRFGRDGAKPARTFDLIGCTIPELLAHLDPP